MSWKTRRFRGSGKVTIGKQKIPGKTYKPNRFGLKKKSSYTLKLAKLNIDALTKKEAEYLVSSKILLEGLSEQAENAENENDDTQIELLQELANMVALDVSTLLKQNVEDLKGLKGEANANNTMNALVAVFGKMGVAETKKDAEKFESLLAFEIGDDAFEYLENLVDFLDDFNEDYEPFLRSPGGMVPKEKAAQFGAYKRLAKLLAESIHSAMNQVKVEIRVNSSARSVNNAMNENMNSNRSSVASSKSAKSSAEGNALADLFKGLGFGKL